MSNYITAIALGVGAGMLLTAAGNKATSHLAIDGCKSRTDTHKVVFVSTFLGDTYACLDKRYL